MKLQKLCKVVSNITTILHIHFLAKKQICEIMNAVSSWSEFLKVVYDQLLTMEERYQSIHLGTPQLTVRAYRGGSRISGKGFICIEVCVCVGGEVVLLILFYLF